MLIRAYHGYSRGPYGDFMDDLKAEAAKFLQAQAAPVVQQFAQPSNPPPIVPQPVNPQPVQRAMLASATAPAAMRPGVSPIVLIGLAFLAYKMLKKR